MLANVASIGNAANNDPRQCEGIQERDQLCIRARIDLFFEIEILGLRGFTFCAPRVEEDETICFAKT